MARDSKPQEGERILAFEEPVDLDIMVQETDEEANWLAYLRRARKALGNDASPETVAKWLAQRPQGE